MAKEPDSTEQPQPPYMPPASDGNGAAPAVEASDLDPERSYLLVLREFTTAGYVHRKGMVLDPESYRRYAPKTELTRIENGYLRLIGGADYETVLRELNPPGPVSAGVS